MTFTDESVKGNGRVLFPWYVMTCAICAGRSTDQRFLHWVRTMDGELKQLRACAECESQNLDWDSYIETGTADATWIG